jgi:N-acetylmuramoyl-L-alanine amidase
MGIQCKDLNQQTLPRFEHLFRIARYNLRSPISDEKRKPFQRPMMYSIPRLILLITALFLLSMPASAVRTVVIDAGHGGHDRGGGPGQRIPEKPYTLDVAQRLRSVLSNAGYRTVMTRDGDYFVTLGGRCAVGNGQRDSIFVSIHFNSAPREGADGIETYYYSSRAGGLASAVHREVLRVAGTEDRRVRRRAFYVIRRTRSPAILCELGFLTNRAEAKRITESSGYRQQLAEAIARGIQKWD